MVVKGLKLTQANSRPCVEREEIEMLARRGPSIGVKVIRIFSPQVCAAMHGPDLVHDLLAFPDKDGMGSVGPSSARQTGVSCSAAGVHGNWWVEPERLTKHPRQVRHFLEVLDAWTHP